MLCFVLNVELGAAFWVLCCSLSIVLPVEFAIVVCWFLYSLLSIVSYPRFCVRCWVLGCISSIVQQVWYCVACCVACCVEYCVAHWVLHCKLSFALHAKFCIACYVLCCILDFVSHAKFCVACWVVCCMLCCVLSIEFCVASWVLCCMATLIAQRNEELGTLHEVTSSMLGWALDCSKISFRPWLLPVIEIHFTSWSSSVYDNRNCLWLKHKTIDRIYACSLELSVVLQLLLFWGRDFNIFLPIINASEVMRETPFLSKLRSGSEFRFPSFSITIPGPVHSSVSVSGFDVADTGRAISVSNFSEISLLFSRVGDDFLKSCFWEDEEFISIFCTFEFPDPMLMKCGKKMVPQF